MTPAVRAQMVRAGAPLPLPPPPSPTPEIESWILRAFARLNTDRAFGMGVGPIPWSAVDRWCERHGMRGPMREVFEVCIERLDAAYLADERKRATKE